MIKKTYIFGIFVLILSFSIPFLNQKSIVDFLFDSPEVITTEVITNNGTSAISLSGKENVPARNSAKNVNYLGEEFTLDAFERVHSPLNEDAPNWAYVLLEGYSFEAALSYSKTILLQNKYPYAIEALPVMMTAFKELNQTGQLESFLLTTIDNLAQEKNSDNDQKIYDLAANALQIIRRSDAYSFTERMSLYKALQSDRMPDNIKKAAADFENGHIQECKEYSCSISS